MIFIVLVTFVALAIFIANLEARDFWSAGAHYEDECECGLCVLSLTDR